MSDDSTRIALAGAVSWRSIAAMKTMKRRRAIPVKTAAVARLWLVPAMLMAMQLSGCENTDSDHQPKMHQMQAADWSQAGSTTKKYSFVLDEVSFDPDCRQVMGRFSFSHQYAAPLWLYGFGFPRPNYFSTRFEKFRREEGGRWADVPVGYCGTGATTFALEPNIKYVLLVPLWPFSEKGTRGQVGVPGEGITVVSEPFETGRIQQEWKSHRSKRRRPAQP